VSVVAPPEPPRSAETEALIREARERQRRRWATAAACVAGSAAVVIATYALATTGPRDHSRTAGPSGRPAAEPRCRADQLAISFVFRSAAVMGEEGGLLRFTNTGRVVCRVSGWPSVVAVRVDGSRVEARRILHAPMLFATYWLHGPQVPSVSLRHGASGYAILGGFDNPVARAPRWRCPSARRLLVSSPGSHRLVSLSGLLWAAAGNRVYVPLCGGKPFVSPIRLRPVRLHIP
jgi:Protein of unknown function (DUF4232)